MKKWLCAALLVAILGAQTAQACTIFTVTKNGTVLFAGNEDQASNKSYLVVDKTGKYGVVFIATPTDEYPLVMQMGVNAQGLAYDINSIGKETLKPQPNTTRQTEWALVKLMRETGSVDELLGKFFTYDWGPSIAYQIHVADRFGNAVVIHPGKDGRLTYTRINKATGYLISTNFNLRDLDMDRPFSSRYKTTEARLKALTAKGGVSPGAAALVLEATHQAANIIVPVRTIYSTVVDLNTLDMTVYYESRFDAPHRLSLRSLLAGGSGKSMVPLSDAIGVKPGN